MTQPRPQIRKAVIHLLGDAFHCVNRANEPERARLYAEVLDDAGFHTAAKRIKSLAGFPNED